MSLELEWIKTARIIAEVPYPPVSAWELEQLRTEEAVRKRLERASVYIIAQRPMLWFENVEITDEGISLDIDDGLGPPVRTLIDLIKIGLCRPGETVIVESGFHHDAENLAPPWNKDRKPQGL